MSDLSYALGKAASRLSAVEREIAQGTWRPSPDMATVILRHTLGIIAALQATIGPVAAMSSS